MIKANTSKLKLKWFIYIIIGSVLFLFIPVIVNSYLKYTYNEESLCLITERGFENFSGGSEGGDGVVPYYTVLIMGKNIKINADKVVLKKIQTNNYQFQYMVGQKIKVRYKNPNDTSFANNIMINGVFYGGCLAEE